MRSVPLVVALRMADGQVFKVAVAAFAKWLNVFQRGILQLNMQAAYPTRYLAVQLPGDGFVNF